MDCRGVVYRSGAAVLLGLGVATGAGCSAEPSAPAASPVQASTETSGAEPGSSPADDQVADEVATEDPVVDDARPTLPGVTAGVPAGWRPASLRGLTLAVPPDHQELVEAATSTSREWISASFVEGTTARGGLTGNGITGIPAMVTIRDRTGGWDGSAPTAGTSYAVQVPGAARALLHRGDGWVPEIEAWTLLLESGEGEVFELTLVQPTGAPGEDVVRGIVGSASPQD